MKELLYGAAYYDEYMPYERLDKDIEMMKAAGINVVRIAESTWGTMEPQNGVFHFYHIDRVLDAMHKANIYVIVGTPTYAVPTWMVKEHPEVLATTPRGKNKYGPRQNMDIANPTYLFYAERAIRKLLEHVKDHPAVIGYQLDNETKYYGTCGENVQVKFVKYMKEQFQSLDELNMEFGLDYWSNRINTWEDFPNVDETINASLKSEFSKFQRKLVTDFLAWQASIVREYKTEEQFITHNFDLAWKNCSFGIQTEVNHFDAAKCVDIAGVDIYHPSQDELTGSTIAFGGDIARSMKGGNYFVLETEAQAFLNWVPYPGQLRLQAFSHLASGADMVAYWHWHSLHNAIETYWKGLLSHDFEPNPTYEEAKTIGKDFRELSPKLVHLKKKNQVAILFSNEALTALNSFGYNFNGLEYNDVTRRMYDELYKMNIECDFLDPSTPSFEGYSLIVVPPLYAATDDMLEKLNEYVYGGGHVVYALRSGFSNEHVKVRTVKQPGIIDKACGVNYSQFVTADKVKLKDCVFEIKEGQEILSTMMELLTPVTAKVLARYDHPYWKEYAAITQNEYGKGSATYIGCFPTEEVYAEVFKQVLKKANLWGANQEIAFPLITRSGINQEGKEIHYYFNYSMEKASVQYPYNSGVELLTKTPIDTNEWRSIEPWGVLIIETE